MAIAGLVLLTRAENPNNSASQTNTTVESGYYLVAEVIDGDTIKVNISGKTKTIRLIGIDSPELPDGCFARSAASKARQTLLGQQVRLEPDKSQDNRDRYDRLLRYVILPDGANFNRLMVAEGYAREFTFITPYKFQAEFKKAQGAAKKNRLGLWSPGVCG